MEKNNIIKNLSIFLFILLLATSTYGLLFIKGAYHNLDYYVGALGRFTKNIGLCLVLLYVSDSFKSLKRYNWLNYISAFVAIVLIITEISLYSNFIGVNIQPIYLTVYLVHEFFGNVIVVLLLVSLFIIKHPKNIYFSNKK